MKKALIFLVFFMLFTFNLFATVEGSSQGIAVITESSNTDLVLGLAALAFIIAIAAVGLAFFWKSNSTGPE